MKNSLLRSLTISLLSRINLFIQANLLLFFEYYYYSFDANMAVYMFCAIVSIRFGEDALKKLSSVYYNLDNLSEITSISKYIYLLLFLELFVIVFTINAVSYIFFCGKNS